MRERARTPILLPAAGQPPLFRARPEQLAKVLRRGRARRRRRAAVSGGVGATAFTVVVLLAGSNGSGVSTLEPTEPVRPVAPATPSDSPSRHGPVVQQSNLHRQGGPVIASSQRTEGAFLAGQNTMGSRPAATRGPALQGFRSATDMRTSVISYDGRDCTNVVDGGVEWCGRYSGATEATQGVAVNLAVDVCRTGMTPGTLTFDSFPVDFAIYDNGEALVTDYLWRGYKLRWRWSTDRVAPPPSSMRVEPRTCIRWSTTWSTRNSVGELVSAGSHVLAAKVAGDSSTGGPIERERDVDFHIHKGR